MGEGHQADYYMAADQRFLGTERFVDEWQARIQDVPPPRSRQSLARALQAVAAGLGVDVARSVDRSWAVSRQRTQAAYLLIRRGGYRTSAVAAALHHDQATVSVMVTRLVARLSEEPITQCEMDRLAKRIKI